jgi:hypothetical protein
MAYMTQPKRVTVSSATRSAWMPLNAYLSPFNIGIACVCSSNKNFTYSVEYSHDSPLTTLPCSITRSTTTATLTLVNHGLTTSDSIIVTGSGDANLDGTYQVASVSDQNTITYAVVDTGATASSSARVAPMRVFTHSTLVSKTANADGNIAYPVHAVRLNVTPWVAGYVTMLVTQAGVATHG